MPATSDRVQCSHCGGVYNLGGVEVVARYADCTMFKAPCCGRTVDDRRWVSMPSFERLPREAVVMPDGTVVMSEEDAREYEREGPDGDD